MRNSSVFAAGMVAACAALLSPGLAKAALFSSDTRLTAPAQTCARATVNLTATVSTSAVNPAQQTPSGAVGFSADGRPLATVPLDGTGVARFLTSALPTGTPRVLAEYSGDFFYFPSSAAVTVRVNPCEAPGQAGGGGGGGGGGGKQGQKPPPPPVTVAAAGDIACGSTHPYFNSGFGANGSCQQLYTSNMLASRPVAAVLPLGDLQYDPGGSLQNFQAAYHASWGRFREITHPAIGNHEYDDGQGAQGYWDYWNGAGVRQGRAGRRGRGWYSYDLGAWHLVALNSNCEIVSCRGRSRQIKWLRRKLRRNKGRCTLAYMHHPRFSSGAHEQGQNTRRIWKVLYRRGVDVVLAGHEHAYERFAPQRPSGRIDGRRGITQFIAGTGGASLFPLVSPLARHSRAAAVTYGVLFLRLAARRYEWSFVDTAGRAIDQGARTCEPGRPGKDR